MKFKWSLLLILLIPILFSLILIQGLTSYVLIWWFSILIIGLIFIPITSKVFSKFFDKGYLFSKVLGLAILTFTMWLLSSFKILPFYAISVYLLIIVAFVVFFIVQKGFKSFKALFADYTVQKSFVIEEALFLLCLVFFAFVKAHNPASGVEARMDFAFLNNLLNTKYMPPMDIWFAGAPTNYYYYGQYIFAFLTKICNIDSSITYNLSYVSLFAFSFFIDFFVNSQPVLFNWQAKDEKCYSGRSYISLCAYLWVETCIPLYMPVYSPLQSRSGSIIML